MCIIIAKKRDVKLPNDDILKRCFTKNPDGAGLMYVDNGKVIIDKGYMTYKSFNKHYKKLCKKYNDFEGKSLVIHFRIGTDGSITPENTHPYIVCDNYETMKKTYYTGKLGMAHNGIIYDYRPTKNDGDIVDTMKFIKDFITPIKLAWNDFYKNDNMLKAIKCMTNSRLCFLDNKDDLYFSGDFVESDGIMYSNDTFRVSDYISKYRPYYSDYYDYDGYTYGNKYNTTSTAKIWKSETKKEEPEKNIETFKLEFTHLKKNDVIITQDGRRYIVSNTSAYYYDDFAKILYRKEKDKSYKQIFKECTVKLDKKREAL